MNKPKVFFDTFDKHSTRDSCSIDCIDESGAWEVWQAAVRYERNRRRDADRRKETRTRKLLEDW